MEALWDKITFSNHQKKKTPDYFFLDAPTGDSTWVQIKNGSYSNVVYSYGKVELNQDSEIPILKFDYNIIDPGEYTISSLQENEDFVTIIGDILTDIIIKNEPIRENYTEESDLS